MISYIQAEMLLIHTGLNDFVWRGRNAFIYTGLNDFVYRGRNAFVYTGLNVFVYQTKGRTNGRNALVKELEGLEWKVNPPHLTLTSCLGSNANWARPQRRQSASFEEETTHKPQVTFITADADY